MKICFLPIDNRPVCYTLAKDICAIDGSVELILPPREYLGDLVKQADIKKLTEWLKTITRSDAIILSLDTLVYGGLIPSRRSSETIDELKIRLAEIKQILKTKNSRIYAFSSIMRISNNNYNEEEKEYWSIYGKKIFEYSYKTHKDEKFITDIPQEIIDDYLKTRKRNFEVNKTYLEWQKEGLFDTLIFSKDDCAEYGFNVQEAQELEELGGRTKTGADEIPLTLLARAVEKKIKVFVEYTEPEYKDKISNYEDVSIEKSVVGQLELGGFEIVKNEKDADLILLVNNFIDKQGELVMGWNTKPFDKELILPDKPFAVADVRYANGADNAFVGKLLNKITPLPPSGTCLGFLPRSENFANEPSVQECSISSLSGINAVQKFAPPTGGEDEYLSPLWGKCHEVTKGGNNDFYGYAGWNTSANTLGTILATIKLKWNAEKYDEAAFKKLQIIRFLDDWAYQANVRGQIEAPCDISSFMKPYEEQLSTIFDFKIQADYIYPWNRKFEVEVVL